ncbi:hypothetical protein [Halovivax sp.]|uniref:DUF7093 family protein n=1 Tax=Halovivax sp. TaxID=1935978 RepID=UPI0025B9FCC4|nr:hypothetical protein [Halovivax sp.]
MVVRCSLLGHDFGAPEIERQREERGSEVVVTVEEYEECSRCGTRNVLSENTEVKTLAPEPSGEPTGSAGESAEPPVDQAAGGSAEPEGTVEDEPTVPTDEDGEPITDDAEILDDSGGDDGEERDRGEWPSADDVGAPAEERGEPRAWPEDDREDGPGGSDQLAASADVDDGEGESGDDAPADRDPASGIESAGEAPTPGEGAPPDGVPSEFFCPRCEFVAPSDRGSLRAGDICPECKRGYLGERERRV